MIFPSSLLKSLYLYLYVVGNNRKAEEEDESISLSSSNSYMRDEIGYVTEVNLVRNNRNKSLSVCLSEYL